MDSKQCQKVCENEVIVFRSGIACPFGGYGPVLLESKEFSQICLEAGRLEAPTTIEVCSRTAHSIHPSMICRDSALLLALS